MQNQILAFFVICCVALGILCAVQWKHLRREKLERAQLIEELGEQAVRLDGHQAALDSLGRERDALNEKLVQSSAQAKALQDVTNRLALRLALHTRSTMPEVVGGIASGTPLFPLLWQDPAARDWFEKQQRQAWSNLYHALGQALDLNQEEQFQFWKRILDLERQYLAQVRGLLETPPGPETDPVQEGPVPTVAKETLDEEIRAFLGETRYALYKGFFASAAGRVLLEQFRERLAGGLHSLGDKQYAQLVASLDKQAEAWEDDSSEVQQGTPVASAKAWEALLNRQQALYDRLVEEAQAYLSQEQIKILAQMQTNHIHWQQVGMEAVGHLMGSAPAQVPARPGP